MAGMGTLVNILAVLAGSGIGLVCHGKFHKRFQDIVMQACGMATIFIGISGTLRYMFTIKNSAIEITGTMMMIVSLLVGSLLGELINVEKQMDTFGGWLKKTIRCKNDELFVDGFITASLIVCVGAMAVVGSIQDGIHRDPSILYAKSILDAIIALFLASSFGKGVAFSALTVGVYEGLLTLLAGLIAPVLTQQMIANLSLVGSVLILGVGINLIFGKKIKVGNMLPAMVVAVICGLFKIN